MDYATFSQLVSSLGFPIVCCCYLAYSNEKLRSTIEENTKTIESLKQMIFDLHVKEQEGV